MFKKIFVFFLVLTTNLEPVNAQDWLLIDTNQTNTNKPLRDIFFTFDSVGYIVGGDGWGTGVILKTTNSGNTWSKTNINKNLTSIYFPSKDTGFAVGENLTILKTIDAGNTWNYQIVSGVSSLYTAQSVVFLNNNIGFVTLTNGPGYAFLKTYDSGNTWIVNTTDTISGKYFSKINDSTVYGIQAKLSKTYDYGSSWLHNNIVSDLSSCEGMYFFDPIVGYSTIYRNGGSACSNYSSLMKTNDGGNSWIEKKNDCGALYSVFFPSNNIGYMLGTPEIGGIRKIWKSYNSGSSWLLSEYDVGVNYYFTSCYGIKLTCTDSINCYIITNYGTILKTTNGGGTNWIVGLEENLIQFENDFIIYPNPASSAITIESKKYQVQSIRIMDVLGQEIYYLKTSNNKTEIDISHLPSGIYILQLQSKSGVVSKKFVKE